MWASVSITCPGKFAFHAFVDQYEPEIRCKKCSNGNAPGKPLAANQGLGSSNLSIRANLLRSMDAKV
jgi:hypothetical protein